MKLPRRNDILYVLVLLFIVGTMSGFLYAWWQHFRGTNPQVVAGVAFVFQDELPFSCSLLWDEQVLQAPIAGKVHYPQGRGPRWVGKGETLAVIRAVSGSRTVRAADAGYFVGGLDGQETHWNYLGLWQGENPLPEPEGLSLLAEGETVESGQAVGKLIPQPQELRAVGYLDGTERIIDEIHRGILETKENPLDLPFQVSVRVARSVGWKRKVYLTLPLFPSRYLLSRSLPLTLCLAKLSGVILPESAVIQRDGRHGIFVVEGRMSRYRKIRGRPVGDGKFLVLEGLKAGEIVIVNGSTAKEGKVQLW